MKRFDIVQTNGIDQDIDLTVLGDNFVCAHAGDEIRRIKNTSFFIGLSRKTSAVPAH